MMTTLDSIREELARYGIPEPWLEREARMEDDTLQTDQLGVPPAQPRLIHMLHAMEDEMGLEETRRIVAKAAGAINPS